LPQPERIDRPDEGAAQGGAGAMTDETDLGTFDYVVVGAGSAGCVLANRLSADPSTRVLLLEAGGRDDWIWFHIPVGYLFAIGHPRADWLFETIAQPGLDGRALAYPRGKVIGGSSSINAMIYMRGQAQDYNAWRQNGLVGWGWADVLPFFLRHEDHIAPRGEHHRSGGEYRVEHPRVRWEILDAIREAGRQAGVPMVEDFNGGDNSGSSYFQVNQRAGRRWSTASAFLKPVLARGNLRLETGVEVQQIELDGRRVTGLQAVRGGQVLTARVAGELILAAGAIGSPLILQRSGIGDPDRLARAGVAVRHALPGVGANLQDHLQIRPVYKVTGVRTLNTDYANLARRLGMGVDYALRRSGPLTMAPSQLGMFCRSDAGRATPNLQFHFQPLSLDRWGEGLHRFGAFTASVCNLRPTSRGEVGLSGPGLADPPRIDPNYLATEADREVAVASLRWARRIASQPALARYAPQEFRPGAAIETDEDLLTAAKALATTIFHPVGTAAMGTADDPLAVVDERLRVRGLDGLRVVDASVMPAITSGNTNAPTVMIAEKGAAMILEDRR
jgi:choline dehydrogenase-like flavoprotein